jgi:hypothetical protein
LAGDGRINLAEARELMVSRRRPMLFEKPMRLHILQSTSPLGKTLHKACNGVHSITCRNRHCPKCQAQARERWLAARERELLPVPYFHVVFTLPHELNTLCLRNARVLYDLLFGASAAAVLEVAANPKRLGARIGFISILHTWGQNLLLNPHS